MNSKMTLRSDSEALEGVIMSIDRAAVKARDQTRRSRGDSHGETDETQHTAIQMPARISSHRDHEDLLIGSHENLSTKHWLPSNVLCLWRRRNLTAV